MKLATSTWVKVALIGLLCLGVCGWLGGCGRGMWFANSLLWPGGVLGCVGVDVVDGVADEVRQGIVARGAVETTDEGSHFEIASNEVNAIELNWLAGKGTVLVVPDAETDGKVLVDEVVHGGRAPVMVCETGGGVLSISYMEDDGLSGCSSLSMASKDVAVKVPASLAEQLELFELEAASGHYEVEGLTCDELELGVASGEVNATAMAAQRASLNVASGRVSVQGSVAERLEIEQASGTTTLSLGEGTPTQVTGSLASGNLVLEVPASTRLETNIDKTSGSFNNNVNDGAGAGGEVGAPTCSLDFDILSGSFTVNSVE